MSLYTGTIASEIIAASAGNDTITGAGLNLDTIYGGGGADLITDHGIGNVIYGDLYPDLTEHGDGGDDTIYAGLSNYVVAGSGDDIIVSDGNSALIGGLGNDSITSLSGSSIMLGEDGSDTLIGSSGNDTLDGGAGVDSLVGGAGNDNYVVDNAADVVIESVGGGVDTIRSSVDYILPDNVESIFLTGGAISVTGNALDNNLTGNAVDNVLSGLAGNDTIDGGVGADTMLGGAGTDIYVVDNVADVVTENPNEGNDTVQSSVTYTLSSNVENLTVTGLININGAGNELDNLITGNSADNVLTGLVGNDTINGGAGNDSMSGGLGDDVYYVDSALDVVTENVGEGTDAVITAIGYTLKSNLENLSLTGLASVAANGNELDNTITGNAGDNMVMGFAGNDGLIGNGGNDTLNGGVGNDTMIGGLGDDKFYVDSLSDVATENVGEGTDTVVSYIDYTLGANFENLTLSGTALSATGNELSNVLTGNSLANALVDGVGNDTLDGGSGIDTMAGGVGNDTYIVDNLGDVITENAGEGIDTIVTGITYSLVGHVNVDNLTLTGLLAINATGNDANNILTGNDANNSLTGGIGNDSLVGGAGVDTLNGGVGNDTMAGGLGNDAYYVDSPLDVLVENIGEGTDTVVTSTSYSLRANFENLALTSAGAANVNGNDLDNVVAGNDGANMIWGLAGNDKLTGNAGNDTLDGGVGIDTLIGGLGDDKFYVDTLSDIVTENVGEGTDTVVSYINYTLGANIENLTLSGLALTATGNTLNNFLIGNALANTLVDGVGNDTLDGGSGIDTMAGGVGNDTYIVDNLGDVVTENVGEGSDTIVTGMTYSLVSQVNIENLTLIGTLAFNATGNDANNVLIGNDANNALIGGLGNDSLVGGAGVDTLDGGVGNDTMAGGLGNDAYYVDSSLDVLIENLGDGIDTVVTSTSYSLRANFENLALTGIGAANVNGNELDNVVAGNNGDNLIWGLAGNDKVTGNGGNDTLNGGVGIDTMIGGLGNDTFYVDTLSDVVTENSGEGTDTVISYIDYTLGSNLENLTLADTAIAATGNELNNLLTGTVGDNVLAGAAGNDTLNGGVGSDTMIGGLGDDTYLVNIATDVVIENAGEGTDTIQSSISYVLADNFEKLTLTGGSTINGTGNQVDNLVAGNAVNNILSGGLGNDTLYGGGGLDQFSFDTALNATTNVDHVLDFTAGSDHVLLSSQIFGALGATGPMNAAMFHAGAGLTGSVSAAQGAGIYYDTKAGTLYYDPDGFGGVAGVKFAVLDGVAPALKSTDFIIGA
jgi:Ca2+-binding RTX toxin-like protein